MPPDLDSILKFAAHTVFSTMLKCPPEFGTTEQAFSADEEHVAGSVSVAGACEFVIYFHSSAAVARKLTCRMLSMTEAEVDGNEMVNDAIGELTNMLAGQVKLKFAQAGQACLLRVPSIIRGKNLQAISIKNAVRRSVYFKCHAGLVLLEAMIPPPRNGTAPILR